MAWKVPFLDLRISDKAARQDLLEAVDGVFRHGRLILGPEVEDLERRVAAFCGRRHAVGVASGTDALSLGLNALGIGPGDEVIVPALSWIATANAVALTGATPVFADIGDDHNIDPASASRLVTPRTRALVPVHYTGKICRMAELRQIADQHRLQIVEDAAQAFGASLHGRPAGSFGTLGCFSMNPMKVFAACGEAGMVVTDRDDFRDRLLALRYNGTVNRETCIEPGRNARLDTVQAAILLVRLDGVDGVIRKRREIASWYGEQLAGIVETPREALGEHDVYYTYTIRADRRDELKAFLELCGIETKIQHPILMPDQPAYQGSTRGELPNARRLVGRILCIPVHEKLTRADVDYVASCIRKFYRDA